MDKLSIAECRQMLRKGTVAPTGCHPDPVFVDHEKRMTGYLRIGEGTVIPPDAEKRLLEQGEAAQQATLEGVIQSKTTGVEVLRFPADRVAVDYEEGTVHIRDAESTGTGLRYNQGKPPMELVPIRALAEFLSWKMKDTTGSKASVPGCLFKLAKFQERALWRDQADSAGFLHAALSELGFGAFAEAARVFDYGRNKYHEWNWAGGFLWSVPLACAVRHLMAMADGQENDEESGLPHRGHVACNIIMLLTFLHKFPELDNRPPLGTLRKELPL